MSTLGEKDDVVAEHHILGGVGDEENGVSLVGQFAQDAHHLALSAGVEARGGFIQEEKPRPRQEFGADAHALGLPAAQSLDLNIFALAETERFQHFHDAFLPLVRSGVGREAQARRVVQRLVNRQLFVDGVVLRHVAEVGAVRIEIAIQVGAVDQHGAIGGGAEAIQCIEEGGFARTADANDGHELARADRERDVLEQIEPLADELLQV